MEAVQITFLRPSDEVLQSFDAATPLAESGGTVPGPWGWLCAHPSHGLTLHVIPSEKGAHHIKLNREQLETLRKAVNHLLDCPDPTLASVRQALGE